MEDGGFPFYKKVWGVGDFLKIPHVLRSYLKNLTADLNIPMS